MPFYDHACKCGYVHEFFRDIGNAGRVEKCPKCGEDMERIYTLNVSSGNHPTFGIRRYYDQSIGVEISSEKQRQKVMRNQKVIDYKDAPSKNPLVLESADKWKWRKSKGLA